MPPVRVFHGTARCRWCKGLFVQIFGFQWVCARVACAARQVAHAIHASASSAFPSPFLYLPLPLQVDIEESPVKRLLVFGAAGFGKSFAGRWSLYARCRRIPGYCALLVRCTYDQLEKNHLRYMEAEAKWLGDAKYEKGTVKRMAFNNGSDVRFGYCADKSDIPQYRGAEYDDVLLDEAVQIIPEGIEFITSRDRGSATSRPARALLGITGRSRLLTNPGGPAAMYLEDFYIAHTPDPRDYPHYNPQYYSSISGDLRDNPYLDEDYESASLGGLEENRWQQFARGRWDVFPGQFFETFDPVLHVQRLEAE